MGQRHQIYIIRKSKSEYTCIGAFHHQWCYGLKASSDVIRLALAVKRAKVQGVGPTKAEWSEYYFCDHREVDVLTKAIYGIDPEEGAVSMVHNEAEYLIDKDGNALPENGDNNDGCALVLVDEDKQEVRLCLFTPSGVEGEYRSKVKNWVPYSPSEYLAFYYNEKELGKMDSEFRKTVVRENPFSTVSQAEFNKIFKKQTKKKTKGAA
jgi:hypothetical protein